ncbi:hypothetical protein IWW40_000883 [Coemansia sp. RSA 1250]|nr:hypothetical protein IWW40_000883 [Coemansia sp. RSA 1250]
MVGGSELQKVPRFQHTMEIFNGQLCVFGGKGPGTDTNLSSFVLDYRCVDITKSIDQNAPKWRLQGSASQFAMPPLAQHTTVYNRYNHVIVPFGGQSPVGFSKAINLAVYCTLFQAWGASNVVDRDVRRYVHTAVLQEKSGDMVVFGGASDDTTAGGDSQGSRWLQVNRLILDNERHNANQRRLGNSAADNTKLGMILSDNGDLTPSNISGVIHHSSILLNDTQMVVLGGDVYDGKAAVMQPFDTVYIYDIDTMKWRKQNCTGDVPPKRCVFSASQHNQDIYIFGGVNVTNWSDFYNDLYALDTLTWVWRKLPTPNAPVPRYAHQMKTLGDYLIITHGYIQLADGKYGGDPDIYFYDLNKKAFVSKYSPSGISKAELDIEWREKRTGKTNAVVAICHILAIVVTLVALYYLVFVCRDIFVNRSRPRARRQSGREGIRSFVESYAETLRPSSYFSRPSVDARTLPRKSFATEGKSGDGSNMRSHSLSEGTTTVVDGEQTQRAQENMRHARILDESNDTPYVSRKLTLSANIPTYRARRSNPRHSVRFSGCSNDDLPSMQLSDLDEQIELATVSSDEESMDEIKSPLKVVNSRGAL